eukprot:4608023-Prymnesium_polylepis.2
MAAHSGSTNRAHAGHVRLSKPRSLSRNSLAVVGSSATSSGCVSRASLYARSTSASNSISTCALEKRVGRSSR